MTSLLFVAHVLAFGVAALVCGGSIARARRIDDPDTRRGLVGLLATCGGWASAHVLFLVVPTADLKHAAYLLGLVLGFAAVGAWLYFCLAFTGRTLHRASSLRRLAVGVFLVLVAVKLTNPLHHAYVQTRVVTSPFPHLAVVNQPLHWITMGLAYALALVGGFMLVELFWQVGRDTTPLVGLLALTGLPGLLDTVGMVSPQLLGITYEPLGVAVFSVGVLYVYLEEFQTVRVTGSRDDPTVVVDDDGRIRGYNPSAAAMYGELTIGDPFDPVLPEPPRYVHEDGPTVEYVRNGTTRYYQLSVNPFTNDHARVGQVVTFTDVTERERYRQNLEDQNERLEEFTSMVSHDLRNPLNVAVAQIGLLQQRYDDEHLDTTRVALDRMETLIEDLLALAREGQVIDETRPVSLAAIATRCWDVVASEEATLSVENDVEFAADVHRLEQLLENLFRNAIDHGGEDVAIRVGALADEPGFYVVDDGPGIPTSARETVFESGHSTNDGTGLGLAIASEIVDAHGWAITVTDGHDGGARFQVTGVELT